jgi:hypothetical protein
MRGHADADQMLFCSFAHLGITLLCHVALHADICQSCTALYQSRSKCYYVNIHDSAHAPQTPIEADRANTGNGIESRLRRTMAEDQIAIPIRQPALPGLRTRGANGRSQRSRSHRRQCREHGQQQLSGLVQVASLTQDGTGKRLIRASSPKVDQHGTDTARG